MKTYLILSILGLFCSAYANESYSQSTTVSLDLNEVNLEKFFSEIEKESGYLILYKKNLVKKKTISVQAKNENVDAILDKVLDSVGLAYHINGKQVIIVEKAKAAESKEKEENKQADKKISGMVTDKDSEPLTGVSVIVKGTNKGTVTDINGSYSLDDVSENATLVFSYIGYDSKEIAVSGKKIINLALLENDTSLDEVVVVGFGTQKKLNLTGSVSVVDAKVFEERPVANAVLALQGAMPGLNISNAGNGGELDGYKTINIRGVGTVGKDSNGDTYSNSDPLILIDGMEGDLSMLNPQDIESVSVLKDAAATSIYGSRAPFGAILVTTKSGKKGRASINYNNNFRFNTPIMMPEMMNSLEYANYFNDGQFNNTGGTFFNPAQMQKIQAYMNGEIGDGVDINATSGKWDTNTAYGNTDWLNEYYRKWAPAQEHNLSVNGGTDRYTYYISMNYQTQEGFMRYGTENHDRYALTGKISAQLTDHIKAEYTGRFSRLEYDRPSQMTDNFYGQVLRRSVPMHPVTDPNGYYLADATFIENLLNGGTYYKETDNLAQQLKFTVTPLAGWDIIVDLNAKIYNNSVHEYWLKTYGHYAKNPDETYVSYLTTSSYVNDYVRDYVKKTTFLNSNAYTRYSKSLGNHNLNGLFGFQFETEKERVLSAKRLGLIVEDITELDNTQKEGAVTIVGNSQEWGVAGYFGRFNYDYAGRYLFEFNLRYDESSRFREDSRSVWAPSASIGWNLASEDFFEPLSKYVQVLKPRFSYGELANQNTRSYYPTYETISFSSGGSQWIINDARPDAAAMPGLVSETLTWEVARTTNVGIDWGLFNNRLTGSYDYFVRETLGMLGKGASLPAVLGTDVPFTNSADLRTFGWELQLGWRDRIKDFSYGISLNISDNQTKVLRFANDTGSLSDYIAGELVGNIYGFTTIGIAKTEEEMNAHLASLPNGGQNKIMSTHPWSAGDIMYKDINGDGEISTGDNTIYNMGDLALIGNSNPRFRTGIVIDASYKGVDMSMTWQGVLKRDYYPEPGSGEKANMVFWGMTAGGRYWSTGMKPHLDYFRANEDHPLGQNLDAYYARPLINTKNKRTQTFYLQDASYMRLKNLQLGYTLPSRIARKMCLQKLRFYVSGENLLTFTNFTKTMDPETAGLGGSGGVVYPLSTTYSFGVSVNF